MFFSAHGVPLAYVEEAGDPYKAEMEECVDLIMEELETRKITNASILAYQVTTLSFCDCFFCFVNFFLDCVSLLLYCPLISHNWKFHQLNAPLGNNVLSRS